MAKKIHMRRRPYDEKYEIVEWMKGPRFTDSDAGDHVMRWICVDVVETYRAAQEAITTRLSQ